MDLSGYVFMHNCHMESQSNWIILIVWPLMALVPRCRWFALVSGFFTRSHFIHPRATVGWATTVHKSSTPVNARHNVESLIWHVTIYIRSGISFSIPNTVCMSLESLLHDGGQRNYLENIISLKWEFHLLMILLYWHGNVARFKPC